MLSDPQKNKNNETKYPVYFLNKMCIFFSRKKKHLSFFLKKNIKSFFLKKNIKSFSQECVTTSLSLIDSCKINERHNERLNERQILDVKNFIIYGK